MLLAEVVAVLEAAYPPALAEAWDAVGLVCGDPADEVRRVLFAVDPVEEVVAEALERGADLLVTHHPLYLRGTTSVAGTTPKGRVVQALLRGGCALHVAHTNADRADPGVSDALADLFGLRGTVPLQPVLPAPLDTLSVTVPVADAQRVLDALHDAGAGQVGAYDRVAWSGAGQRHVPPAGRRGAGGGRGRPGRGGRRRPGSRWCCSARGGRRCSPRCGPPTRTRRWRSTCTSRCPSRAAPAWDASASCPARCRCGPSSSAPHAVLPATSWGVRAAGDPDAVVRRLAVSGGAGDSLLAAAAASGAQAFLTSDLRHHPASEAPEGLALLDAAHWATESPWLAVAAARLARRTGLVAEVSRLVTDPFRLSSRSPHA